MEVKNDFLPPAGGNFLMVFIDKESTTLENIRVSSPSLEVGINFAIMERLPLFHTTSDQDSLRL